MRRGNDMVRVKTTVTKDDPEFNYEEIELMPFRDWSMISNYKVPYTMVEEYKYRWYSIEYLIDWIIYHIRLSSSGGLRHRSTIRPNDSPAQKAIKRGTIWLISIILAAIITVFVERKFGS